MRKNIRHDQVNLFDCASDAEDEDYGNIVAIGGAAVADLNDSPEVPLMITPANDFLDAKSKLTPNLLLTPEAKAYPQPLVVRDFKSLVAGRKLAFDEEGSDNENENAGDYLFEDIDPFENEENDDRVICPASPDPLSVSAVVAAAAVVCISDAAPAGSNAVNDPVDAKHSLPKKTLKPSNYQASIDAASSKKHEDEKKANRPPPSPRMKPSPSLMSNVSAMSALVSDASLLLAPAAAAPAPAPAASLGQGESENVANPRAVNLPNETTIAGILKSMHHFCGDIVVKIEHPCIHFTVTENDRFPIEDVLMIEFKSQLKDRTALCKDNGDATYTYTIALENLDESIKFKFEVLRLSEQGRAGSAAYLAHTMMAGLRAAQPQAAESGAVDEMVLHSVSSAQRY